MRRLISVSFFCLLGTLLHGQVSLFTTKSNIYSERKMTGAQSVDSKSNPRIFDGAKTINERIEAIRTEYKEKRDMAISKKNTRIENLDPNGIDFHEQMKEILSEYSLNVENANSFRINSYEMLYFQVIQSNGLNFLPTRNRIFTKLYYNANPDKSVESLKSGFLNFNSNGRSLYTEFIAGFLPIGRLSFGGQYSYTDIEQASGDSISNKTQAQIDSYLERIQTRNSKKTTVQNFLGGGGNAIINLSIPILSFENFETKFDLGFSERLSFNIPKISSTLENPSHFFDTGLEAFFAYDLSASREAPFGFYTKVRSSWISGSDSFYSNLGIDQSFMYCDIALGFNLFKQFRLGYYFTYTNLSNLSFPSYVAVSFTP